MPKIDDINARLKRANLGIAVYQVNNRLYLRGTFPPKPSSNLKNPHQQWISLGVYANDAGFAYAETEAYKVGSLLAVKGFTWEIYQEPETCKYWIDKFKEDYFSKRAINPKTLTTWNGDYWQILKRLEPDEILSEQTILNLVLSTKPDSRIRKRAVMVLNKFSKFCGLDCDLREFSPRTQTRKFVRELPTDSEIVEIGNGIGDKSWQWAFRVMATYGLRNHEIFHLDFSEFPILIVLSGKTGFRDVMPIYPEWAYEWELNQVKIPNCSGKCNGDLGNRVTRWFNRHISFNPYSLRHRWAVRSLEFGIDVTVASRMMGHSLKVHTEIYHQWINRDVNKRMFERLMSNPDRPKPPI